MRTTLSLDDDVLDRARLLSAKLRKPVRAVVNEALRTELTGIENGAEQRQYVTDPHPMGLRQGYDLDNIGELIAQIEGEAAR
ncbi:MAG: DUF2191 domain-containing protein [Gammaproteobacteria bacterium]|nr:DUF2191 domain-containing protein [Gammaproteobacteria bacterium]MDE0271015.1 DUF2191 domain-containing protein [Gammaproteobacteria bacterium]